ADSSTTLPARVTRAARLEKPLAGHLMRAVTNSLAQATASSFAESNVAHPARLMPHPSAVD
ncbi:MAG: hypothetical protein K2X36_05615, partial [Microbacteriaceae bacterium]|nr:hypothetical protein [Microbacteriaceae bacterium]